MQPPLLRMRFSLQVPLLLQSLPTHAIFNPVLTKVNFNFNYLPSYAQSFSIFMHHPFSIVVDHASRFIFGLGIT